MDGFKLKKEHYFGSVNCNSDKIRDMHFVRVTFWSPVISEKLGRAYHQAIFPVRAVESIFDRLRDGLDNEYVIKLSDQFMPEGSSLEFMIDYVSCQIPADWILGAQRP